jgi:hypothetical protein
MAADMQPPTIRRLEESLINRIAAGEVWQRLRAVQKMFSSLMLDYTQTFFCFERAS